MQKFKTLADAIALAEYAHRNQVDKAGLPYIDHPKRVLQTVQAQGVQPFVQIAAVFHDVPEDTAFSHDILLALGFSEAVVRLTRLLDRDHSAQEFVKMKKDFDTYLIAPKPSDFPKDEIDDFYYRQIKADRNATIIKLADIQDNLSPWRQAYLEPETQKRLQMKYAKALEILNPIPQNHGMLTGEIHNPFHLR